MNGPPSTTATGEPRVYVILLNWNGWDQTLSCLESVLRSRYGNYRVIVVDNGSRDESVAALRAWARGELAPLPLHAAVAARIGYTSPPRPVAMAELSQAEAERRPATAADAPVTLIRNPHNLGFAGGNNVALRHVLARGDGDYAWLLNNDTVIAPDTLECLVEHMRANPRAGLCGSTLIYYDEPDRIQALGGGVYNPWLGTQRHIGQDSPASAPVDARAVERQMAYVVGASMLVSRAWLKDVGLLCEDYFLYFEELDWAIRGRGRYQLAFAPRSRVYHKEGRSIGRPATTASADYYALRSRLLFTLKRMRWAFPSVWLSYFGVLFNRVRRGQLERVPTIVRIMLGQWTPQR